MFDREKIKHDLPFGCVSEIAKIANVSVSTVSQYLSGKIKSSPIVERTVLDFALKNRKDKSEIAKKYTVYEK